jgi:archaellum biogenesis ATPase FlaH
MITFEYGMLVLDKNATKEDVTQIDAFAEYVRNQERERIIKLIEESKDMVSGQEKLLVNIGLDLAMAVVRGER